MRAETDVRAWEAVLDRLEADVGIAERLACSIDPTSTVPPEPAPWPPPALEGEMPAELLGRAREVHLRQLRALTTLAETLERARLEQRRNTRPGRAPSRPADPAFLDVSA